MSWWIDSGATRHVCKDKPPFMTMEQVREGIVLYMGNSTTAPVLGIGNVELNDKCLNTLDFMDLLYKLVMHFNVLMPILRSFC